MFYTDRFDSIDVTNNQGQIVLIPLELAVNFASVLYADLSSIHTCDPLPPPGETLTRRFYIWSIRRLV
jgi:hypothetical protein